LATVGTIIIPARYNGPANSGNGGYSAGALAELVDGSARISLKAPPPLDTPLTVVESDGLLAATLDGSTILEARPAAAPEPVLPMVTLAAAQDASTRYLGLTEHGAPTCFVCGTARPDGLRIFPGPTGQDGLVASPWIPDASVADADGNVATRVVWGALDCPGAWAAWASDDEGAPYFPALAGMTATVLYPIEIGVPHVVVARYSQTEGRKIQTSAAIFTADGELRAHASHLEIKVPGDWAQ
jgi:hypothetical protein